MNKRLKRIFPYVFLLVFPLLFYFLNKLETNSKKETSSFQFYTSVKCLNATKLSFYKNNSLLVNRQGPLTDYTPFDFVDSKHFADEQGFRFKLEHTKAFDTLSFLAINFFIDDIVYTLQPELFKTLTVSDNATNISNDEQVQLLCKDSKEIWVEFKTPRTWKNDSLHNFKYTYALVFFLLFVLVTYFFQPEFKPWISAFLLSIFGTLFLWYLGLDASGQIRITGFSGYKPCQFYFNSIPVFKPSLSENDTDTNNLKKTQAYPNKYQFYRIDLEDSVRVLPTTEISYGYGLFSKTWPLNKLKPFQINANAIDKKNKDYFIHSTDPYLCLTSAYFTSTIKLLDFLRSSVYLFFGLLIYTLLLLLFRKLSCESRYSLSYLFLMICFFSPLYLLFNSERLIMSEEKRLAYSLPIYNDLLPVKEYTKQLDNYMKDQLPGRGQLIIANNYIKYKTFSELATNPMVYFGKKDWMFYIGENVKEIYENKRLYTEEELKKMMRNLEERRDWLKEQGISYYVLFPRMSHYFYQENVGEGIHQYIKKPRLEQFLEYLQQHSTVNVIDVYSPMLAAKNKYPRDLYYRSDSHWNLFGAYFAYVAVIQRIQKDYPQVKNPIPLQEINWVETESDEADLSKLISLSNVITRHEFLPLHPDVNSSTPVAAPNYPDYHSVHPLIVYQGKDSVVPSIVMNRDSYSNFLIPYFSKHFSRQTYVWSPLFFPSIIEKEKPAIVISEMMERFVNDLLIDNPPLPAKTKAAATK